MAPHKNQYFEVIRIGKIALYRAAILMQLPLCLYLCGAIYPKHKKNLKMFRKCIICGERNICFQIPSKPGIRALWMNILQEICDTTKLNDYSVVCIKHFHENDINRSGKRNKLNEGTLPSVFDFHESSISNESSPCTSYKDDLDCSHSKFVQVDSITENEVQNLRYHRKVLNLKLKRITEKYHNCLSELKELQVEKEKNSKSLTDLKTIYEGVKANDEKAILITDIIKNYCTKAPRWSGTSIRLCTTWRNTSPKGYEFGRKHLINLPSKMTMSRYLDPLNGVNPLIKDELNAEINQLENPVEPVCSIVIDDVAIKDEINQT